MSRRCAVLLVLVTGLALGGCVPYRSSRTCEEIGAADLRALIEETTSLEQAATRVVETFHVPAEEVGILRSRDKPNDGDIDWRAGGVHYTVIVKSSKVLWARMTYESDPPSADEVIQCLGAPDRYWASFFDPRPYPIRRVATLNLYYPALAVTCWGNKRALGDRPPEFDGGVAMTTFHFVPLGPPEEVMTHLVAQGMSEEPEGVREEMKPWPADWRKVEVQSGPY